MKRICTIIFLLLACSITFAQSKKDLKREGLAALDKGDFITTKENYLKLLEKGVDTWETYTILGDCEFHTGNPDQALAYYRKGQEKNPIYPGLYLRVANVLRQQKKFDEAIMNFRKMTITNPRSPQIYNMISSTYFESGDYQAALNEIDTMVKLGGENFDSSYGRSVSHVKLNKIAEACVELEKAKKFDTENMNKEIDILRGIHCMK